MTKIDTTEGERPRLPTPTTHEMMFLSAILDALSGLRCDVAALTAALEKGNAVHLQLDKRHRQSAAADS